MRFALMHEPQQGTSYADQLALARGAEAAGFEAIFRSDHYESFPGPADRPTTDAWAVIAGLARETTTIRLGVLMSPVTYRLPGNLAKIVTTVDEMSGGRIEVALGAAWHEDEHRRHGFPFPPIGDRATMLEEQLEILDGLWNQPDGWSFSGRFYTVADARLRPRPSHRIHVLVGGEGSPRSMRIAARFADEFNLSSASPERAVERSAQLDDACRAIGRDPATIRRSAMVGVLVGADEGEFARRVDTLRALLGGDDGSAATTEAWLAERRTRWIVGTPDEARAMVRRYAAAGLDRIMLQDFLPWDLEMVDLLGRELVGRV
ncbi:MAG: TIGR03560 family F420-dependent LLM class oxidoreductase [Candidatus Limnocylindrales bacterium]